MARGIERRWRLTRDVRSIQGRVEHVRHGGVSLRSKVWGWVSHGSSSRLVEQQVGAHEGEQGCAHDDRDAALDGVRASL